MPDNTVTLVGNITRDPELRFTPSGQPIATFGMAVNRRFQRNGQWEEQTSFFNITAWGTLGENASSSLQKGARVLVNGRLEQRSWETQEGEKRSVVEVVADEIGPSLRWATVEVTKNERREGGEFGGGGGGGGAAASRPASNEPTPAYAGGDEEPF
ncbi:MAG TPA: single-stranded DNA-binding protein [Acidimicrobiales bacterium]|jgi:single-strand DNA-binding protein|nr:single-stranded DNA-binding protein [Acidimicrobiales bacterium]